jgi:5,10-methylenetetrahydrofolate reductase
MSSPELRGVSARKSRAPTGLSARQVRVGLRAGGPGHGPTVEIPVAGCPKRMVFGPCGGVRDDGRCELAEHPCVFLDKPLVRWPEPPAQPRIPSALLDPGADAPVVLADLSVTPFDPASVRRVVAALTPVSDGLLAGEHANRPDFPPTMFAAEVIAAGGRIWTTLACRDRNRVVLEQELAGLAAVGVDGVLCVTGDGRGVSVRPGVTQVFDLDGVRLAALAAGMGLPVAVPESPEAPPVDLRPARVAEKQRAGAQVCVLNHVSSPARIAEFVVAARAAGATLPFVAGVAVYTDEPSARVLQRFPGLHLDGAVVERVLAAPDPRAAGIAAAVEEARALLAIPGVVGVNLSGSGSSGSVDDGAEVKAEVAARVRGTQ